MYAIFDIIHLGLVLFISTVETEKTQETPLLSEDLYHPLEDMTL